MIGAATRVDLDHRRHHVAVTVEGALHLHLGAGHQTAGVTVLEPAVGGVDAQRRTHHQAHAIEVLELRHGEGDDIAGDAGDDALHLGIVVVIAAAAAGITRRAFDLHHHGGKAVAIPGALDLDLLAGGQHVQTATAEHGIGHVQADLVAVGGEASLLHVQGQVSAVEGGDDTLHLVTHAYRAAGGRGGLDLHVGGDDGQGIGVINARDTDTLARAETAGIDADAAAGRVGDGGIGVQLHTDLGTAIGRGDGELVGRSNGIHLALGGGHGLVEGIGILLHHHRVDGVGGGVIGELGQVEVQRQAAVLVGIHHQVAGDRHGKGGVAALVKAGGGHAAGGVHQTDLVGQHDLEVGVVAGGDLLRVHQGTDID